MSRIAIKSFDELMEINRKFTQGQEIEQRLRDGNATPIEIPLERLTPFAHHPFKRYSDEKMQEMVESVKAQGVLLPILARPIKGENQWEIISGHNRVEAARLAGLTTVPGYIRDVDDNTATIMMVDSNFYQRDRIFASEKAFAYKLKLEAIRRQGERTDLSSSQIDTRSEVKRSNAVVAEEAGESSAQIARYIRLTELIPALLDKVDTNRLGFIPAVSLSYLKQEEQIALNDLMDTDGKSVSIQQAEIMKQRSQSGTLDEDGMLRILTNAQEPIVKSIKIPYKQVRGFFLPTATPKEMESTITRSLKLLREHEAQQHNAGIAAPITSQQAVQTQLHQYSSPALHSGMEDDEEELEP